MTSPTHIDKIETILGERYTPHLRAALPDIDPPVFPVGYLMLCQLLLPKRLSTGGIIIPGQSRDDERFRVQTSLVRAMGPACFKRRDTGEDWPERNWVNIGDFIRGPLYGGDRVSVKTGDKDGNGNDEEVVFVFLKDADVIGKVIGDPLNIKVIY